MDVILFHSNQRHVSADHVTIFRVVRTRVQILVNHSTLKNRIVLVKIAVNYKTDISIKYYNLKIVVWNVVLFNVGHMSGRNMSVVITK